MNVYYGYGEPDNSLSYNGYYIDLYTDTFYEYKDGKWVVTRKNGLPTDEYGNILDGWFY